MMEKDHISDEELRRDFPLLFSQKKEEDFSVPEGYFSALPTDVLNKIKSEEKGKVIEMNSRFSWKNLAVYSGIAAALIVSFSILFQHTEVQIDPLAFSESERALISEEMILEIDDDLFIEAIYSNDFDLIERDEEIEEILDELDIEDIIYEL